MILIAFIIIMLRNPSQYDMWIATFLLYVGSMQVIEALIWLDMTKCGNTYNPIISKWLQIYLIGQIVVNTLWAYKLSPSNGIYILGASLILLLYYIVTLNKYTYDITIGKTGHLVWNAYTIEDKPKNVYWYRTPYLVPLLTILWFAPFFIIMKKNVFKFWPFIYLAATYIYSFINGVNTNELSSLWCFFISFGMISLIFIPSTYFI